MIGPYPSPTLVDLEAELLKVEDYARQVTDGRSRLQRVLALSLLESIAVQAIKSLQVAWETIGHLKKSVEALEVELKEQERRRNDWSHNA